MSEPTEAAAAGPSGRKLRIAFVTPSGYPVLARDRSIPLAGGAEVQQAFLARELARRGHTVSMISMDFGQREGDMIDGVRLLAMHKPLSGLPAIRFVHPRFTSLWAAMRRADADVYCQRAAGAITGQVVLIARAINRRMLFAGANDGDFDTTGLLVKYARDRAIYRWGVARADHIVVQTERQRDLCRTWLNRDSTLIRSCYEYRGRHGCQDGDILWVGSVKPHKRPELFLEVARRLPQYRLRLVGGPAAGQAHFDALELQARELGNVEITGFVPYADVDAQFDGAAVLVNTSISEGFPNTFLQAWARRIPTVSFFDPHACLDGRSVGCVARDLDAMVETIRMLKEDRAEWQRAGSDAQACFQQRHTVEAVVDSYERIVSRLVGCESSEGMA